MMQLTENESQSATVGNDELRAFQANLEGIARKGGLEFLGELYLESKQDPELLPIAEQALVSCIRICAKNQHYVKIEKLLQKEGFSEVAVVEMIRGLASDRIDAVAELIHKEDITPAVRDEVLSALRKSLKDRSIFDSWFPSERLLENLLKGECCEPFAEARVQMLTGFMGHAVKKRDFKLLAKLENSPNVSQKIKAAIEPSLLKTVERHDKKNDIKALYGIYAEGKSLPESVKAAIEPALLRLLKGPAKGSVLDVAINLPDIGGVSDQLLEAAIDCSGRGGQYGLLAKWSAQDKFGHMKNALEQALVNAFAVVGGWHCRGDLNHLAKMLEENLSEPVKAAANQALLDNLETPEIHSASSGCTEELFKFYKRNDLPAQIKEAAELAVVKTIERLAAPPRDDCIPFAVAHLFKKGHVSDRLKLLGIDILSKSGYDWEGEILEHLNVHASDAVLVKILDACKEKCGMRDKVISFLLEQKRLNEPVVLKLIEVMRENGEARGLMRLAQKSDLSDGSRTAIENSLFEFFKGQSTGAYFGELADCIVSGASSEQFRGRLENLLLTQLGGCVYHCREGDRELIGLINHGNLSETVISKAAERILFVHKTAEGAIKELELTGKAKEIILKYDSDREVCVRSFLASRASVKVLSDGEFQTLGPKHSKRAATSMPRNKIKS